MFSFWSIEGQRHFGINFQVTIHFPALWLAKIHCLWRDSHWPVTIAFYFLLFFYTVMNLKWIFVKFCWLLFVNTWKFILKQLVVSGSVTTSLYSLRLRLSKYRFVNTSPPATNSWFAHDVISCHWAPSWLTLQITSAVYSEALVSIYYFIVSFSVLWMIL